jgi:hypothetical protein
MARYVLEHERIFARLYDLNKAVEALNDLKTISDFHTTIRVSADIGMMVEAALTPQQADYMRVGLPMMAFDINGNRVRQLKFFDGRFTLEWLYVKHMVDKGNAI